MVNTNGGRQRHTLPKDEKTTEGLRTANTDRGGQKHALTRDRETNGV